MVDASASSSKNTPLPPGMVIGPDGKPCRICSSGAAFRNWIAGTKSNKKDSQPPPPTTTNPIAKAAAPAAVVASAAAAPPPAPPQCPPDKDEIGRATWTFLHTTAAYYPEKPTPNQRVNMLSLLHALPSLYPCSYCAKHLGENLKEYPPDVSGRAALSQWLCQRHNDVNRRMGKTIFDCDKTDERWKDGPADGSCN